MTPRSRYLALLGHEVHVTEWGDPASPALVMWHGLTRTGRDFDELAGALADRFFVICPDTIGRGLSSWTDTPEAHYRLPYSTGLALALLDHYAISCAAWLGTSMGGQIGITVAAQAPERIAALIINDIGPDVPPPALDRIVSYSAEFPSFAHVSEAEAWLREIYVPFGPAADPFWTRMAETSVRRRGDGSLTLHYDPRIIGVLDRARETMDIWEAYDRIKAPTAVLRGAQSDLLTEVIASKMATRGPRPEVFLFPECGHAPSLNSDSDAVLVRGVLEGLLERASA